MKRISSGLDNERRRFASQYLERGCDSLPRLLNKIGSRIAAMASGWAPDGAVQDQIDDTIINGVMRARGRIPTGEGETYCLECGDEIRKRAAVRCPESGPALPVSRRMIAVR